MTLLEKRHRNAVRVTSKINPYIENQDYLVFDEGGNPVTRPFILKENGDIVLPVSDKCNYLYFKNDWSLDNGAHTTIRDFNRKFDNWRVVAVKDLVKLEI